MTSTNQHFAAFLAEHETVRVMAAEAAVAALNNGQELAPGVTRDDVLAMVVAINDSLPAPLRVALPSEAPAVAATPGMFVATDLVIGRRTDKAVFVTAKNSSWVGCWLPNSQIKIDGDSITMPLWLARKNTLA